MAYRWGHIKGEISIPLIHSKSIIYQGEESAFTKQGENIINEIYDSLNLGLIEEALYKSSLLNVKYFLIQEDVDWNYTNINYKKIKKTAV